MIHLKEVPRVLEFIEAESRIMVSRGRGRSIFSGYRVSI